MQILYTKAYKDGTEHLNAFDRVGIVFAHQGQFHGHIPWSIRLLDFWSGLDNTLPTKRKHSFTLYMCACVYVYVTYVITFVAFQTSFVQKNCIVVVSSLDISSYGISLYCHHRRFCYDHYVVFITMVCSYHCNILTELCIYIIFTIVAPNAFNWDQNSCKQGDH